MARVTQKEAQEREAYMIDLIKADPTLSAAKLNEQFRSRFKNNLRTKKVFELKRQLGYDGNGHPIKGGPADRPAPPMTTASRGEAKAMSGVLPIAIKPSADESPVQFGARVVTTMHDRGVTNLRVLSASPEVLVIDV